MLKGKKVILGVTGSIAAYKAAEILSLLKKRGAEVRVIITESATRFVQPLTFSTLSGYPVASNLFYLSERFEIEHISLAQWADLILVAPATANIIGKVANGIADDLLTTTILAFKLPVIFAPAMNKNMISNPIYQENVKKLISWGYEFIDSGYGRLACGEVGEGRLADLEDIIDRIELFLTDKKDYQGKTVLITASCTREPLDEVRFISNYSSGKMGFALAKAARNRGANVILVSGPTHLPLIKGVDTILVETAEEMEREVFKHFEKVDLFISAAAVSDFRPKERIRGKLKKEDLQELTLELERNPDILLELGQKKSKQILVGFAAETDNLIVYASEKLRKKNLDLIIANDLTQQGAGFGSDQNRAKIIDREGRVIKDLPLMSKREMADQILDEILRIKAKE